MTTGHLTCALAVELAPSRRDKTVGFSTVSDLAGSWGFPCTTTIDGTLTSLRGAIRAARPHFVLVIGWSRIVTAEVLDIPMSIWGGGGRVRNTEGYGCIGMHPTRLPQGRGQAPIPWTILRQLPDTALTTFFLEDGVDSGAIIRQDDLPVRCDETAASLFLRFADLHYHAGLVLAHDLAARRVIGNEQDQSLASVWPRRHPSDGLIDLTMPAERVVRLVRAQLGPYPRAYLKVAGVCLRLIAGRPRVLHQSDRPGRVIAVGPGTLTVTVADGVLDLEVDPRDHDMLNQILAEPSNPLSPDTSLVVPAPQPASGLRA
ncbi:MAG TPA: formyltransferase family protein [Micromonosporaceae bacterium]|nr:formyltransferase family protein [Micromonosporaceae bacterium]